MSYNKKSIPWHIGTGVNVSDCKTSEDVMKKAELDWYVNKCGVTAKMPFTLHGNNNTDDDSFIHKSNIYRDLPNAYATYRTDTNTPLGLVKSKYEVVQNTEAFNFFDSAIGENKAQWEFAGYLGYGQKIFVTAKLPFNSSVNDDPIDNYLIFSNAHDGTSSVSILFAPVRVACTNMLHYATTVAESFIRIRHTKTVKEKLEQGTRILKIACEKANSAEEFYQSLYAINMTDDKVLEYLAKLTFTEAEYNNILQQNKNNGLDLVYSRNTYFLEQTDISTRKANTFHALVDYYFNGVAQQEIKGTLWGAYNAITGYYGNVYNIDGERRMNSMCYGNIFNKGIEAISLANDYKYELRKVG